MLSATVTDIHKARLKKARNAHERNQEIMFFIRNILEDADIKQLAFDSNVSETTLRGWASKKVYSPRLITILKVVKVAGYDVKIITEAL